MHSPSFFIYKLLISFNPSDIPILYAFSINMVKDWHEEIAYRVMEKLLRLCGGKLYAAESEEILRLLQALLSTYQLLLRLAF